MIWAILGIEETKDKKAISRAYRERLSAVNPEEKPKEFKELRAAYEKALALADTEEKPLEEKTDLELWTDELASLYFDLRRRLDVSAWEKLLSADVCQALDTRSLAEEAMLEFFKENFRLSHKVMVYLNDQFGFTEHMDELREKFPADFLEYVIESRVRYEENFPFALFTPGMDGKAADIYESTYRKIFNTDQAEAQPLYDTLKNSSEKHPYGEALLCKIRVNNGDLSAVDDLIKLHEAYPDDDHLAVDLMVGYEKTEKYDIVGELADQVLGRNPDHMAAKRFKAEAEAAQGRYKEAVDIIQHLMTDVTGEQKTYYELDARRREWNDAMMVQLREKLDADPDDSSSLYDLLWCLIQNERSDEAQVLAEKLPLEQPDPFGYYNVKSVLASDAKKPEEALEYTKKLLAAVDNLKPDGTTRTQERIGRRTEVIGRISNLLFELGRKDEALEMADQSTDTATADLGSVFNLLSLHIQAKNYERANEIADAILAREPGNSGAYYLKAMANFKMGRDNIAFEAVNSALDQDGSSLPFYLLKLRILVRNRADDGAKELIDFLEENGIKDDFTVNYCKLHMFVNQEDEEKTKTVEEYDTILAMAADMDKEFSKENADVPDWAAHFYYLYAMVTADRQDFDKEYPVEPIIKILDKGLDKNPDYYSCISYKAWLLKKNKQTDEALELYQRLEQYPGHNLAVEENLGEIYYSRLQENAEKALQCYKCLIENNPENPDNYFFAGMCCFRMEQPEEARRYFELEQKYAPDDIDGYFRNTYALLKLGLLDEAVENGKKTVEIAKKREGDTVRFWNPLILAYRRMGKVEEAIAAINECAEHNEKWDPRNKIFSVYLQFGMFDEAHKHISKWSKPFQGKEKTDTAGWTSAKTRLLMLEKVPTKLTFHLSDWRTQIDANDARNADMMLAAAKGKLQKYMKIQQDYYNAKAAKGNETPYEKGNLAWALFVGGELEKAQDMAAEALQEEDEDIKRATGMTMIHKGRRIRLLAIMGFEAEARKAAEEAKTVPLCETCEYCSCKDMDIYMSQMEFILGNYGKALEMAREFQKKWPDDEDFIELEYLIKAKGKK